ncbi:MAG: hypothetical protein NTV34_01590 [Proteobacteria bacterium]|nr:hypothetical protein [Pseudomonadota bacterium]
MPNDNAIATQTQHTCGTYTLQPGPHWCNPALFALKLESAIKADAAVNADQDGYETTDKLLYQTISKEFLATLFSENNFQSFSGMIRLEAVSQYLSFSYIPLYAAGAYKLTNPSLPEINASGHKENRFCVTSAHVFDAGSAVTLYSGASLFLYDRTIYHVQTNALELIVKTPDEIVETQSYRGLDSDLGVYLAGNNAGSVPALAFVAENVFSPQHRAVGDDHLLAFEPNFGRKSRAELSETLLTDYGSFYLGIKAPYWGFLEQYDRLGSSIAGIYGIGRLRALVSYSPLMTSFGFMFMTTYYHIGIQYTNEKQDNSIELERRKNANLFLSFNF